MNKTNRAFPSLSIDQAHEKNNKIVKGDEGAIGFTESSTQSLHFWSNVRNNQRFRVVPGMVIWRDFVSQSRRMDQRKHKGHLWKLYYRNMRDISRIQRDRKVFSHFTPSQAVINIAFCLLWQKYSMGRVGRNG